MTLTIDQHLERVVDRGDTHTLTKVTERDDYFDCLAGSTGFGLKRIYGVTPKPGDTITLYTHQGSMIHGIDLNGEPLFYKTRAEQEEDRQSHAEAQRRQRDEEYETEREQREAAYDALPDVFKHRIDWFRAHNDRFRQDYEPYEMSACIDAVKIAAWAADQDDPGKAIVGFQALDYDDQKQTIPDLDYGRHSGNSFGFAVRLAHHYVTDETLVYLEHGAMTPLVGCEDYGCAHPREETL